MRYSRPAQQRVWLGSYRYRGSCRDTIPNRNANSYANSDRYPFSVRRYGNTYTHGDAYSYRDSVRLSVYVYEWDGSDCSRDNRHR